MLGLPRSRPLRHFAVAWLANTESRGAPVRNIRTARVPREESFRERDVLPSDVPAGCVPITGGKRSETQMTRHVIDAAGRLIPDGDRYLPVNPSNRYGDVVWARLVSVPRMPWTHEDDKTGEIRNFAYVIFDA